MPRSVFRDGHSLFVSMEFKCPADAAGRSACHLDAPRAWRPRSCHQFYLLVFIFPELEREYAARTTIIAFSPDVISISLLERCFADFLCDALGHRPGHRRNVALVTALSVCMTSEPIFGTPK